MENEKGLVFFDGVCGLCNRSVNFLLRIDRKRDQLRFAPLQSQLAAGLGLVEEDGSMNSMVLQLNGKLYFKSTAALRTLCLLYTSPSPRDGATSRMPSSA